MKYRVLGLVLGLGFLTACQQSPTSPVNSLPVGNLPLPAPALTAESCHQTLEAYMKAIQANPEKYKEENLAAYPEMVAYGKTLGQCQQNGFLTPQDMMRVAEKVDAETSQTTEPAEQ